MFHLVINLIRIRVIRMAMSYECKDFMIHQNLLALTCLIQFKVYLYIYGKDSVQIFSFKTRLYTILNKKNRFKVES